MPRRFLRLDRVRLEEELGVRGATWSELANRSGLDPATLSQAANGRPMHPKTLALIARALENWPEIPGARELVRSA